MEPRHHDAFWQWCNDVGVEAKRVAIQGTGPTRGLFAAQDIKNGAVVVNVPFAACMSLQSVPMKLLPPPLISANTLCTLSRRTLRMTAFESSFLWLSGMLATFAVASPRRNPYHPYMRLLPTTTKDLEASTAAALRQLTKAEQQDYWTLERQARRAENFLCDVTRRKAQHIHFTGNVPNLAAVRWAHRMVLSRAILLPSNCVPSAPEDLATYLDEHPDAQVMPALVPVVDLINNCCSSEPPNCVISTCKQNDVTNLSLAPRIVVCACRDIPQGEELTLPYDMLDRVVSLLRYGYLA